MTMTTARTLEAYELLIKNREDTLADLLPEFERWREGDKLVEFATNFVKTIQIRLDDLRATKAEYAQKKREFEEATALDR